MSEYLTWQVGQLILACSISGIVIGTSAYQIEQHYRYPEYKPSTVRATTYTGKGQFKCQIGC